MGSRWPSLSNFQNGVKGFLGATFFNKLDKAVYEIDNAVDQLKETKVDHDEITGGLHPLNVENWTYLYADLPTASSSNKGAYLYCTDGNGVKGAGNYVSNGTSWYFGGTGNEGYFYLKTKVNEEKERINNEILRATHSETELSNRATLLEYRSTSLEECTTSLQENVETLNQGGLNLNEGVISTQVQAWLDEHPESTSTVQDGSLTKAKLSNTLKNEVVFTFNTIAEMTSADYLTEGMTVNVLGYYNKNDGGNALYYIVKTKDRKNIYYSVTNVTSSNHGESKLAEIYGHLLDNGLYAQMIFNETLNPTSFGAKPEEGFDSSEILQILLSTKDDSHVPCIIDLKNETFYVENTLYLYRGKTLCNGTIKGEPNIIRNGEQWCNNNTFANLKLISTTGYAFCAFNDIPNTTGALDAEIYNTVCHKCYFEGYSGAVNFDGIGFSNQFNDCAVKSTNGHGFTGIKGPGTSIKHPICQGLPNGALFTNCFDCVIENVDSQDTMLYGIYFDKYVNGDLVVKNRCNFENIIQYAVYMTADIADLYLEDCSFSRHSNQSVDNPVNAAILKTVGGFVSFNIIRCSFGGYPEAKALMLTSYIKSFKFEPKKNQIFTYAYSNSSPVISLSSKFHGKLENDYTALAPIERDDGQVIRWGVNANGTFFNTNAIYKNTEHVSSLEIKVGELRTNSFIVNDQYLNVITGISTGNAPRIENANPIGYGTIFTIVNLSNHDLLIKNDNNGFILINGNITLGIGQSACFIYVAKAGSSSLLGCFAQIYPF